MGSFSDYSENKILEHIVGKTSFTKPTCYIALCTGDPTESGAGDDMNEVADANDYARVATAGADWETAVAGLISNHEDITFVEASGAWGTITHFALVDSGVHGAGNMLAHGQLTAPKTIVSGDTIKFVAGDLEITLD